MGVKPWQLVVIALAVLGALGSVLYTCSSMGDNKVSQASDVRLVDIKTGDLFLASYPDKRPVSYPATLPNNHEAVLYPIYQSENKWMIAPRFLRDVLKDKALKQGLVVDTKSGEISVGSAKPVRAD